MSLHTGPSECLGTLCHMALEPAHYDSFQPTYTLISKAYLISLAASLKIPGLSS